jgi:hypothetical protein
MAMSGEPAAFMSYVRLDDQHDDGQLSQFREQLGTEVRAQCLASCRGGLLQRGLNAAHDSIRGGSCIYLRQGAQRCSDRCRNLLAKIPARMQAEVKDAYWKIFDTEDLKTPPGPKLVEIIDARIDEFAARYRALYPAAVKILLTDREGLTAYLRFPAEHHHRIRHSNFIERTFGETRRRVKVIGRLPGETSCLTLVWAVLDRASHGWRGFTMTSDGLRLLQDLRHSLLEPPRQLRPRTTSPAQAGEQPETVISTVA